MDIRIVIEDSSRLKELIEKQKKLSEQLLEVTNEICSLGWTNIRLEKEGL